MPDFVGQLMRQKSSSCLKTASPRVLCLPANHSPFTLNPDAAFDSPSFPVICCWILLFILPPKVSPSMPSSPLSFFSSHPCPLDLRTTIRLSFQSPINKDGQDRGARRGKITTAFLEIPRPREDERNKIHIGWVWGLRKRSHWRCWKLEYEEIEEKKPKEGEKWLGLRLWSV